MNAAAQITEKTETIENEKEYRIMAKSRLVKANEKIAAEVAHSYKKIEESVVHGYKKIEEGAVGGFNKIADKFVDNYLTKVICTWYVYGVDSGMECVSAGSYHGSDWRSRAACYGTCMEKDGK